MTDTTGYTFPETIAVLRGELEEVRADLQRAIARDSGGYAPDGRTWKQSVMDEAARRGTAEARLAEARKALEEIQAMHDGNQPAALMMPDLDYARRTIMSIHRVARAALKELPPPADGLNSGPVSGEARPPVSKPGDGGLDVRLCPFCGGSVDQPFENLRDTEDEPEECWTIRHDCPSTGNPIWVDADTREECLNIWNDRAASPAIRDGREAIARIIYDAFPFNGDPVHQTKPDWIPGGNSLMQDVARKAADAILHLSPAPGLVKGLGDDRNAVIEECAKVVDGWVSDITKAGDQFDKGGDIYAHANVCQGVAAAIRALSQSIRTEREAPFSGERGTLANQSPDVDPNLFTEREAGK